MPQSEMEALLQLQKETIESLRQLVESQRLTIEQMAKSHEEQTAQLNQTIANLNETEYYGAAGSSAIIRFPCFSYILI